LADKQGKEQCAKANGSTQEPSSGQDKAFNSEPHATDANPASVVQGGHQSISRTWAQATGDVEG
jgi:hypothetical protein